MVKQEEIQRIIRGVITNYCDGTYSRLGGAHFIEYSEDHKLPQECVEEMESEMLKYLRSQGIAIN
ncbi:hypothetical protein LCGC14_0406130 [marine sediment metagenome]|uniref:Uncharacterized protein n=1 Tax=marine sediment metagenome TaxID=412755 RepID=A0A0F9T0Y4_9ZZZZ